MRKVLPALTLRVVAAVVVANLFYNNDFHSPSEALAQCAVSLYYLRATRDRVVGPRAVEQIRAICPDLVVVDIEAPHLLLQAAPARALAAILEHVLGR